MPQFNPWIHQPLHSSTLEHMYRPPKQRAREATQQFAGQLGYAAGGAISYPLSYGARRFGQWYYPSEKVRVQSRTRSMVRYRRKKSKDKKVCCRYWKGKNHCSPEFCKYKKYKKYWY